MSKHSEPESNGGGKYSQFSGKSPDAHGAQALAEVDTLLLAQAVVAVLTVGDAILFGTTRDGGAVAMQLFSGTELDKLYGATQEELTDRLRGIVEAAGHH